MRAIRKGLTAGLRESVDWATSTTSTGSSTGLSGLAPLDDVSVGGGGSLPWEEDTDETASEHCVVQLTHATGLAWAPLAGGGACFAFCVGDAADGCASGAYIERMSNACKGCRFKPKQATGPEACPFTTLYWDFLARHAALLKANPRMTMQLKNLDRKDAGELRTIRRQADDVRAGLG